MKLKDKKYCPYNKANKHKCTPLARQESIDLSRWAYENDLDSLKGERLSRKRDAVGYNKLIRAVCNK